MKVAIVHDWLTNMGGAEIFVIYLKQMFPDAPIYTTVYNPNNLIDELKNIDVRTSFLQKKRKARKNHQKFFPYMPAAFESFDLNEYDLVISSSSSCAHGVITNPKTLHLCYCHTPMRYGWEFYYEYTKKMRNIKKKFIRYFMNYMRIWDRVSADRVDVFVANSQNVADRINKHYRKNALVLRSPVRTNLFVPSEIDGDYYLVVSRLVAYKRVDLAVEACTRLNKKLVVIGVGDELEKLKKIAGPTVSFLGSKPQEKVAKYFSESKAFIFCGEEDYGLTPLESQASGRPVIAYKKGGVLETVIENKTGLFFEEQTVDSLVDAINRFESLKFDKKAIRKHAEEFDIDKFKNDLLGIIKKEMEKRNLKYD